MLSKSFVLGCNGTKTFFCPLQYCLRSVADQNQPDFPHFQCLQAIRTETQLYFTQIPTLYLLWHRFDPSAY